MNEAQGLSGVDVNVAFVVVVLLATLAACGPKVGGADGGGSGTGTSAEDRGEDPEASASNEGPGEGGTTTAAEACPQSDLPPPFCHVAQSYGSTVETESHLVPRIMMPLVSPGQPARLIIDVEDEYRLVDAQDFSRVHGVSNADLFGDIDVIQFIGDFNGDGVLDLGVAGHKKPIELYDGVDMSLIAVGPDPRVPSHGNEFPSGWPAAAIDADGDGIDEVLTVELGHDIGVWRVASGTLELLAEHKDVMNPCPGAFLRADFDGDGKTELALPTSGVSCWDGLDLEGEILTIKLISSPLPASLAALPAVDQANGGVYRTVGDLDGDGMTDVVLQDLEKITFLRSTGVGFEWLESAKWEDLGGKLGASHATFVGDVDGDGRADILLDMFDDATERRLRRLHWGGTLDGDSYTFAADFRATDFVDLNGDGHAEIVAYRFYSGLGSEVLIYGRTRDTKNVTCL